MIRLRDGTKLDVPAPARGFQPYPWQARIDREASFRLTPGQKRSLGEVFWTHPMFPNIAFPTRKAAIEAVIKALGITEAPHA